MLIKFTKHNLVIFAFSLALLIVLNPNLVDAWSMTCNPSNGGVASGQGPDTCIVNQSCGGFIVSGQDAATGGTADLAINGSPFACNWSAGAQCTRSGGSTTYSTTGTKTILLTMAKNDGFGCTNSRTVQVNPPPPPPPPPSPSGTSCGAAGGNTCDQPGQSACDGYPAIASSDCSAPGQKCCFIPPPGYSGFSPYGSFGPYASFNPVNYTSFVPYPSFIPAAPTVNISCVPSPIAYNSTSFITWSSSNTSNCVVNPNNWGGTSGAQSTGNLTANTTYTATCDGQYTVITYTTNGTFVAPAGVTSIDYLIVGGGGGGGGHGGGGGGGGGALEGNAQVVPFTSYNITVGAGGAGGAAGGGHGFNGGVSSIVGGALGLGLIGGGGGDGATNDGANENGWTGGSGGGGSWLSGGCGTCGTWFGAGSPPYGNNGGNGYRNLGGHQSGGGGGGAGSPGANATSIGGGRGGDGLVSAISGSAQQFAAGGGGGSNDPDVEGAGGSGGGGNGRNGGNPGLPGVPNTGGGGGGGSSDQSTAGGPGGSGIVMIRYRGVVSNACTVVVNPPSVPVSNNVKISTTYNGTPTTTVSPNNVTPYYISITGTDSVGGGNITHEYALINYNGNVNGSGVNGGAYRGYLTWYYNQAYTGWDAQKDKRLCTLNGAVSAAGGLAAIQLGAYGDGYLRLDACDTVVSGNTRTTTFTVRFDPSFTTPLTDNDISGYIHNTYNQNSGWVWFNTDFNLALDPIGSLDAADCTSFRGWAFDRDNTSASIGVHFYDGPGFVTFLGATTANGVRADINTAYGIPGNHGFTFATPMTPTLRNGLNHSIYAYGINTNGPNNPLLTLTPTPIVINCPTPTLTASFTATPGNATVNQPVSLDTVIGGTATGNINYSIWWDCPYNTGNSDPTPTVAEAQVACGDPDLINNCSNQTLGYKCDSEVPNGPPPNKSVSYSYTTAGTKRPIVIAERLWLSAFGVAGSGVSVTYQPPGVANATVTVNNSNYCTAGPHATISWIYSDPGGYTQAAYETIINGGPDIDVTPDPAVTGLNPSNINPEWRGTGGITPPWPGPQSQCNSGNIDANPQATCQLLFNNVYTAWVRVQNSVGVWSPWTRMSTYVNDINPPAAQNTWTTPTQAFPQVGFTFSPSNPAINSTVTLTDTTTFSGAATPRTWVWDFDHPSGPDQTINASPPTITNGNTTTTYTTTGSKAPRLTATDNLGQSCSVTSAVPLGVQRALPQWREVAPR